MWAKMEEMSKSQGRGERTATAAAVFLYSSFQRSPVNMTARSVTGCMLILTPNVCSPAHPRAASSAARPGRHGL